MSAWLDFPRAWWKRNGGITKLVAILTLTIVLIAIAARFPGLKQISDAWPSTLAAVGICHIAFLLMGVRWQFAMRAVGIHFPLINSWAVTAQSYFYFHITPLGLGADVARFAKALDFASPQSKAAAVAAVLADRIIGMFAMLLLCAATAPFSLNLVEWWNRATTSRIALGLILILIFAALSVLLFLWHRHRLTLVKVLRTLRDGAQYFMAAGAISVACFIVYGVGLWVGAQGFGISISLVASICAASGALFFSLLPLSVFGVGGAQVAGTAIYLLMGLSTGEALILAALSYLAHLSLALVGAVAEALSLDRRRQYVD